jgi:hypothetical protein
MEKVLQEAFANGHFNNLKLLDHDAVFTPDPSALNAEMGPALLSPFLSVAISGSNGNTSKTVWEKLSDADESHNIR